MRSLRLGVTLIAVSAALLAGCTDPSPEVTTDQEDASTAAESPSSPPTPEASEEPSEEPAPDPPAEPVFGTSAFQPSAAMTACVPDALGVPLTFATVLTAVDTVTLDELALAPEGDVEVEILDEYVLPFTGGATLAIGEYPPADPDAAREDVGEYELGAGDTVIVGVGVTAPEATTMGFLLTYHGADGVARTLAAPHRVTIAAACAVPDDAEDAA